MDDFLCRRGDGREGDGDGLRESRSASDNDFRNSSAISPNVLNPARMHTLPSPETESDMPWAISLKARYSSSLNQICSERRRILLTSINASRGEGVMTFPACARLRRHFLNKVAQHQRYF